jgi:hypothetical protein
MVNTDFYSNAKIYKIVDNTNGNIYVGSTCKKLCQRLAQHRSSYKQYLNGNSSRYITSFKILEHNDYDIILLEKCENITDKEGLRVRERHYIQTLECVNKRIEGRNKREYYIDNKKEILENRKKYYNDNTDEILKGQKAYYNKNQDEILEKNRQFYMNNKENILQHKNQRINCQICNCYINKGDLSRHNKTKKHQSNLNKE